MWGIAVRLFRKAHCRTGGAMRKRVVAVGSCGAVCPNLVLSAQPAMKAVVPGVVRAYHFLDDVAPVSELDGRLLDGLQLFAILHEELADLVLQLLLFLQVLFVLGRVKYFFVHILVFLHHFLQKLLLLCLLIGHVLNFVRLAGEERGLRLLLFQVLLSAVVSRNDALLCSRGTDILQHCQRSPTHSEAVG